MLPTANQDSGPRILDSAVLTPPAACRGGADTGRPSSRGDSADQLDSRRGRVGQPQPRRLSRLSCCPGRAAKLLVPAASTSPAKCVLDLLASLLQATHHFHGPVLGLKPPVPVTSPVFRLIRPRTLAGSGGRASPTSWMFAPQAPKTRKMHHPRPPACPLPPERPQSRRYEPRRGYSNRRSHVS
jgi:hypothetical protein